MKNCYNSETEDGAEKPDSEFSESENNKTIVQQWKWFLSKYTETSQNLFIFAINKKNITKITMSGTSQTQVLAIENIQL